MNNCIYCHEPIHIDDRTLGQPPSHMECGLRMALGSVAHVRRRCGCYVPGSTEEDPPGMTRRQAAKAAVEAMREMDRLHARAARQ